MTGDAGWRRLAGLVQGRIRRPGEDGFAAVSAAFNQRYASQVPAGVLSATGVADVRQAIGWARDADVQLVARGGGHSYAGHSVGTGLTLDLSALRTVSVDPSSGLVTVGGGARMSDLYAALAPHGLLLPLGNSPDVGIGGLALGGGTSAVSRAYGLTADTLVGTTLVTADGQLRHCDATTNRDLFWACRGGGGGNFGVNVSFTFRAVPVPPAVSTGLLLWTGSDAGLAQRVLHELQEVARRAPDAFSSRIGVSTSRDRPLLVSAVALHLGPAGELRELLAPVLAAAAPDRADLADRSFWDANTYLLHETSQGAFAARTAFAPAPLPPEALEAALEHLARWPGGGNPDGAGLALFGWGGAINRVPATGTAFPHRDAMFMVSLDTSWTPADDVPAHLRWLAGLHELVRPWTSGGAYLNFTDPDRADWRTAYHGLNYPRLVEVKKQVDPDGFFRFPQAIGS